MDAAWQIVNTKESEIGFDRKVLHFLCRIPMSAS